MSRSKLRFLKFDWGLESWRFEINNHEVTINFSNSCRSVGIKNFQKTMYLEECEPLFNKLINVEENEYNKCDRNRIKTLLARHIASVIILNYCGLELMKTSEIYNSLSKNSTYDNLLHDIRYHMIDTCVSIWHQYNIKKIFLEELSKKISKDELEYYKHTGTNLKYVVLPINGNLRCGNPFEMIMVKTDQKIPYSETCNKFFKNKYNGEYKNMIIDKECNQLLQSPFNESCIPFV